MTRRQPAVLLDRAADWPQAAHEELLRAAIDIEKRHAGVCRLGDAERAGLREARTEIERRDAAADEGSQVTFDELRHGAARIVSAAVVFRTQSFLK